MLYRVTLTATVEASSPEDARDSFEFKQHEDVKILGVARISALGNGVEIPDYVEIRDDPDVHPRQEGIVVLEMLAYRIVGDHRVEVIDSLCDIDFFEGTDYVRGVFDRVTDIPANCEHLRDIARDMRLPE